MIRDYEIRFDTYRNCRAVLYAIQLQAANLREAKEMAEKLWYQERNDERHMFHMTVERLQEHEEVVWSSFHPMYVKCYFGNQHPYMNYKGYGTEGTSKTEDIKKITETFWYPTGERYFHKYFDVYYKNGRHMRYTHEGNLPDHIFNWFCGENKLDCAVSYVEEKKVSEYTLKK